VDTISSILDDERPRPSGESYLSQKSFVRDRKGHDRRYAIDCRKIEEELLWTPEEVFESGILKTVHFYMRPDDRDL
jgi:dTDP-glucose 4,6-dehydratase